MQVKHELINYGKNEKVWVGKYRNSQNLPHWHHDCELLYIEHGRLNVVCDKKTYSLEEGQAFFIDTEQLHCLSAESPDSVIITIFFASEITKPFAETLSLASPVLTSDYCIPEIYRELKTELQLKRRFYETDTAIVITKLMLDIYRNETVEHRQKSKPATKSFKQLLDLMTENYEFFTFESAAEYMGMNPAYFSRFFHNLTGMTFSRYLNYIKINKAVNLIHSAGYTPVTEIAMQCGFSTIRNFNRIFREMTGYTPTKLPNNFVLDKTFSRTDSSDGNPTLIGCVLLESSSPT